MFEVVVSYFLLPVLCATVILWIAAIFWTRRELKELKPLFISKFLTGKEESLVSILLPARNEENRILDRCLRSLCEQTYKNFEVIAVNDRSTDQTGEILHSFKQRDRRIKVIEGAELKADWLGKPFVLQQALSKASGEWILMIDADVVCAPRAVKTAVFYAERESLDALCCIPFDVCDSFSEKIFIPVFGWFRMLKMPPTKVNDQRRSESMGIGNFFLVKRAALEKIKAFDSIKGEVAEDLKLAKLLKQSGTRLRIAYAPDLIETRMYSNFAEIWTGFTKNFFAGTDFSILQTIFGASSIVIFGITPIILAVFCFAKWFLTNQSSSLRLFVPAILIYICQTIVFAMLHRAWKKPFSYIIFAPLGMALFVSIMINSMVRVLTGRGVMWKDRAIYQRNQGAIKTAADLGE